MNLDKVPEEEEADSDTASMRSFDLPITSLQESLPQSFIDKNKQSSLNKSKSQSKKDETSRPSSASLKDNIRPSSGSKKVKPSAPVPPPVPPPQNSSHGPGAPPPPPQAAPPPPPVGADKKSTIYPAAKFSARDLKLSKKKLRRAEEILKMVDVERAEMFDKYKKYKYMPLVDSREYLRTLRAEIVTISFDGIEQLTDAFLFTLHHCKLSLTSLRWISLAGCYYITDEGLYWITQAFPTLKEIFLMGCRNVTEKGLYYLLSSNSNLKTVNVIGTDVGIIPANIKGIVYPGSAAPGLNMASDTMALFSLEYIAVKAVVEDWFNTKCLKVWNDGTWNTGQMNLVDVNVRVQGCPVVSPAPSCKSPVSVASSHRKLVILTNQKLPWSPLAVLTNQKDVSPKQELLYHSDWSPFTDQDMTGVSSSARLFNIFQVPVEQGLSELIISPGSIVVLPYHMSDNVSVVEKPAILHLAETVASILIKHSDCTFVLLGMYKGSVAFDPVAKVEEVVECVRRRYHEWNDRLGNSIRISIHTNWRMGALTFHEQEILSAGEKLLRQGKSLYKEDRQKVHQFSNKPMKSIIAGPLNVEANMNKDRLQFLKEAVEADEAFYPWNRQKLQSQQVLEFGNKVQKNPLPLSKLESVIKPYRISDIGNQNVHRHMAKLMSLAALSGHALYYPILEEKAVITDFKFLADVLLQLFFKSAPRKVDIRSLGNNIPCWTHEDLEKIYPKSKATVDLLLRLLEKHGCFIKIPLDPWANLNIDGVSYVYVLYKDFPEKTAIPIETYWVPEVPVSEMQKDKYYFFCPGLPESFFPNLMRHLFRLGGVVLLWKNGMIIQKGYITILVEKIKDYQGLNVILVQVRMPLAAQENSPHLKTLWTTLKMYCAVVDYMILKYKICAAKSVPCTACIPSTNRYTILESRESRRFFLEHLVRVGDQRDVRCKKCEAASIAYIQVGPYISLHSLVPSHDKYSVGISLHTSNNFSRCLMCENCAIEGLKCPVNLKNGTSNWYCSCNREGKLCDYCGICWRCGQYLMKVVSALEPAFVTPKVIEKVAQEQIVALDKVNVVTKGSILGFIDVQKHEFEDEYMTANLFPVLEISFISRSEILIELKLFDDKVDTYETDKTDSSVEGEQSVKKDSKEQSAPKKMPKWPEGRQEIKISYNTQYGTVLMNDKVMVDQDAKAACKEGDQVRISLKYCDSEFTKMLVLLECNDRHVYSLQVRAQKVAVAMTSLVSGISLSLSRPQKFIPVITDSDDSKKKNCGFVVQSLPPALEMRMYNMLEGVEDVLFGDRGISFTGAGLVGLPSQLSLNRLQYPAMSSLTDVSYHHLCVTWNPKSGKKNIKLLRQRFSSVIKKESQTDSGNYQPVGQSNVDTWNLSRLAHLLDSKGIPAKDAETIDTNSSLLLWSWHYLLASYPKVLLPKNPKNLFPTGVYTDNNMIKVEEGLRQLLRLGFWKYFLMLDFNFIGNMFKSTGWGRRVEFLAMKNKIVAYALVIQELADNNLEKTGLVKIKSKFNQALELYLCPAHRHCLRTKENLTDIAPELCGDYTVFLAFLDLSYNKLETLPESIFQALPNLVDLSVGFNHLEKIPATIKHCHKLHSLIAMENNLIDLPDEMAELQNLSVLSIGNNRFIKIPDVVMKLASLSSLTAPFMMLTEIPEDIGNLVNLKKLILNGNCISRLPKSFEKLTQLEEVCLGGVPWVKLKSSPVLSYDGFQFFMSGNRLVRWMEANEKDQKELFQFFDENSNGVLEMQEVGKLNSAMYNLFPRFGYKGSETPDETTTPSGFPVELLSCTNLRIINLEYQGVVSIPPEIENLKNLTELHLNNNPNLLGIPAELGKINTLKVLQLDECPQLKTPPKEIRDKGFQSIFAYLQRLLSGALLSKRTKLMLVGLGGAGKTSLVRALMSKEGKADLTHGEDITDGIEINTWKIHKDGDEITYNVWDFAGQTVYYNTHQFFLSNRAVYLLLWNVRLGYEHAGLDFWLSSISVQCPKVPIFVVGSHIDQVSKTELPLQEMQQRYPQIVGFHFVSSFTGQGISDLQEKLFSITLQQQYMGEHIPAVWLTFENNIASIRAKQNIIEYRHLETIANQSGIFDSSEIFQAVQFLHDLGTIQHFTNDFLKDKVVINPQWIVDVMACVVSVKTQVIMNGRLHHRDISDIWSEYPRNLHNWLLRLTEEFDLTFQLNNEPINLVPCLLPEKKPEFEWPELEKGTDVKETQMIYKFDYLPAGLFNRGQVRLHQLSDSSLIWKKGSFLKKNVHIALVHQTRDSELVVLVQGPRPENILFLVHEVFEGLIVESFHGVQYDFMLPCPECSRMAVKDQHMFAASTIRRAIEMKAPFLQCIKYFHTISCADLLTLLPPDSHSDFDAHLVQSVQGLKDLKKDLSADIFISHCQMDNSVARDTLITPERVYNDLKAKGYKCWYADRKSTATTDEMAKALIDSSVFMAFVSTNYAGMDECVNIFKYARLTLRKTMVVVAIGDGFDWKQSKIGILLADEVYINMTKQKLEHYDSKFEELLRALSGKTRMVADVSPKPVVFFSYTWVNSAEAVELGTRAVPGAVGYGDPRKLKQYLEEHGVSCWIDVERVGMNGLFDDIAEGLLSAKVVIVCVSDEYAASHTCQIEFRYAANTLKLPIVVAAVGTGDAWRATEVGLLSVYYPIVNFQEKTKNAKQKLLKLVKERLGEEDDVETLKAQKDKANERHKNLSFQELFELAQRKLLRQLTIYAENQDTDIYPRLFVADFLKEEVKDTTVNLTDDNLTTDETDEKEKTDESEKKDKDKDAEEKSTKEEKPTPKPKLTQRQSTRTLLSKKSSTLQPAYKLQKFCVYTLCEHEEAWHSVAEPLELPFDFGSSHLETFSPYLARMTAVMKYNKRLVLSCLEDDIGQDYIKWLEESPEATMSDYQTVYHKFREMVMEVDVNRQMGKLARCHLPNGKTIWLCQKHRETARVTVLSSEEKTVRHKSDHSSKLNSYMVQALRSMDYTHYASQFKASRKAKRNVDFMGMKELKKKSKAAAKKYKEEREKQAKEEKEKQQSVSELTTTDEKEADTTVKSKPPATAASSKLVTDSSDIAKRLEDNQKVTDRQISKESVSSVSTTAMSRQTSVSSVSTTVVSRQTSVEPLEGDKRGVRRQQSQDQGSVSSRGSSASLQRHREPQNYRNSTQHIQRAKTKSRACTIS